MSRAPTNRLVISDPGGHTSSITTKTTPAHLFPNGVALTSMSLGLGIAVWLGVVVFIGVMVCITR